MKSRQNPYTDTKPEVRSQEDRITTVPRSGLVQLRLSKHFDSRKNALYYRSLNGAEVGDLFMSLIHTCQLCGANSFDYLIELQCHARELAVCPAEWMPWNYRDTLMRTAEV